MPNLEVTFQKGNGVYGRDAFVAAKALMQKEMEKHPEWAFSRDPEFRDASSTLTVVQPYKIKPVSVEVEVVEDPEPEEELDVEEEAEEPEPEEDPAKVTVGDYATDCGVIKSDGEPCTQDITEKPCRYHK